VIRLWIHLVPLISALCFFYAVVVSGVVFLNLAMEFSTRKFQLFSHATCRDKM
jgi:hypothetical protein